jgi:sugar phosphate isomerase/epimerase
LIAFAIYSLFSACSGQAREDERFSVELGVCTSVNNHELLSANGFGYIEEGVQGFLIPMEPHESFLAKLELQEQASIKVTACNSFIPGRLKSVGPDAVHAEIIAYADTAFRRAEMAGVETIVFGSGGSRRIPDGFDREEAKKQFISLLKQMGPVAARYNVFIALEPLHRGEVNFINTVAEGLDIVRQVDHPNILLLCDFYHMLKEDEPAEHIIQAADYLRHVHVAEKETRSPPGVAGDDFRPYLRALKEIGYSGGISVEARWQDFETEIPIAMKALQQQIEEVAAEQ